MHIKQEPSAKTAKERSRSIGSASNPIIDPKLSGTPRLLGSTAGSAIHAYNPSATETAAPMRNWVDWVPKFIFPMTIPAAIPPRVPINRMAPKLLAASCIWEKATVLASASVGM